MTDDRSRTWARHAPPVLLIAALFGVGAYLENHQSLQLVKQSLQSTSAHRSAFPGNRTIRFLNRLGVVHAEPNSAIPRPERLLTARRGRDTVADFWRLGATDPARLPSTLPVSVAARHWPLPVISVYLRERDLKSFLKNPGRRGRRAERSAFVTYYQDGELIFGSGVGIRVHGGASRWGSEKKSYRLLFRETYGARQFKPRVLFDSSSVPLRHLVLHNDVRHDRFGEQWHLVNPIAYDISRRIGCLTARTQPAAFWLNGELQGLYVLTEHLDSNYLQSHYGHQRFVAVRTKTVHGQPFKLGKRADYWQFMQFTEFAEQPSLAEIAERVDLDNLSRWFISILICGTTDWKQGLLVLDQSRPDGKWFWINWDMDHSFMSAGRKILERPWEVELFTAIASDGQRNARSRLLFHLIEHHPQYRADLLKLYTEAVNHLLTDEFIEERLRHYERIGRIFELEDVAFIDRIRDYLARRKPILRQRMGRHLGGGADHRVTVIIPPGRTVEIDGYAKTADYSGWTFDTVPVTLRPAVEDSDDFAYWRVDAQTLPQPEVELKIGQDTVIEAVFSPPANVALAK